MNLSTNLLDLIESMTKNERGYFVKFVQSQGINSDYLQFFHAICHRDDDTLTSLKEKHPGAAFLKNIAYSQNYLYRNILKSLRLYYEKQKVDIKIYAMLAEASILDSKGLKKQRSTLLRAIKKKALNYHQYHIVVDVLKMQAEQLVAQRGKNLMEGTQAIYSEIFDTLNILEEELTFRQLNHSILLYYRHGASTFTSQFSDLLKSISDHPLMQTKQMPRSFYAQYLKHKIISTEAMIYGDLKVVHDNYLAILNIWESHPHIIRAYPHIYRIQISNYLGNAILLNKTKDFEKYMNIMESLDSSNKKEKVETFQNIVYLRMLFYLNQNQLEDGRKYIVSIEQQLEQYAEQLNHSRAITICYNFLMLYFLLEDHKGAEKWVSKILYEQNKAIRRDVKFFAQIINYIVCFELEQYDALEHLLKSASLKLKYNHQDRAYEEAILKHFKLLDKSLPGKEKWQSYQNFQKTILLFKQEDSSLMSLNELLIWLKAKIERKPLKMIYQNWLNDNNYLDT